ncbi:SDR family NAD(P)-dependent oxidoreductase [Bradyrhizobium icense]|uniref:SDR family NAD(P)-dependent oxidoreductase n=1 Tax=Bradyrhizobium icense TaxID=1274631 RepID=UPI00202A79F1|nr:SDR family NAD(P)-dependent oxidoreductase [Bradyrhizobium icense]
MQAMADAAMQQFGCIDILVNNAALRREKPFAEMDYAAWREILDVTLDGAFHCVKACLPALRKSAAGTIVNIGGLSAHTGAKNRAQCGDGEGGHHRFDPRAGARPRCRRHHRELRGSRPDRHAPAER